MRKQLFNHGLRRLRRSKLALALPATFLILFVSTLGIVAFTYYFSVERINTQGQTLKVSTAKTNLLGLNEAIVSTLWQPGASSTYRITDSGGKTCIEPSDNPLSVSLSGGGIDETVFNASVGRVIYELPYQASSETGMYLRGDERSVTNQSGASISQVCIENGEEHPEIQLRYRPSVTAASSGVEGGRAVNTVRIYIVNLNGSDPMAFMGTLPLQATCQDTQLTTKTYSVPASTASLTVSASLDGKVGVVAVPISSTVQGALIRVELVVCSVCLERWIV
ncbi:MAG: hypothetical protein NWE93_12415 [Candidatus Bathyarchaeota archaeon]|nr:hypothetical protein [Candidatus Bathyarchaeota archaeon]